MQARPGSKEFQEFIGSYFRIPQNLAKQTATDIVRPMGRHRYYTAVRVPEPNVASFLPHLLKASPSKRAQDFSRPE
jgi:hypothetical protein